MEWPAHPLLGRGGGYVIVILDMEEDDIVPIILC